MKLNVLAGCAVVAALCSSSIKAISILDKEKRKANLMHTASFKELGHFLHSLNDFDQLYHLLQEHDHAVDLQAVYKLTCKVEMTEEREGRLVDYSEKDVLKWQVLLNFDCVSRRYMWILFNKRLLAPLFTPNFQPQWLHDEDLHRILDFPVTSGSNIWYSFSWLASSHLKKLTEFY